MQMQPAFPALVKVTYPGLQQHPQVGGMRILCWGLGDAARLLRGQQAELFGDMSLFAPNEGPRPQTDRQTRS
jgi:hypothetical protein